MHAHGWTTHDRESDRDPLHPLLAIGVTVLVVGRRVDESPPMVDARPGDGRCLGTAQPMGLRPRIVEFFGDHGVDLPLHVFRRG